MIYNHHDNHDGDDNEEERQEYQDNVDDIPYSRRTEDRTWGFTPQSITALVGILGMLTATFWTLSDFRITVANIEQKLNTHSERMVDYDRRLNDLDKNGSRALSVTESELKSLQKEVEDLKDAFPKKR